MTDTPTDERPDRSTRVEDAGAVCPECHRTPDAHKLDCSRGRSSTPCSFSCHVCGRFEMDMHDEFCSVGPGRVVRPMAVAELSKLTADGFTHMEAFHWRCSGCGVAIDGQRDSDDEARERWLCDWRTGRRLGRRDKDSALHEAWDAGAAHGRASEREDIDGLRSENESLLSLLDSQRETIDACRHRVAELERDRDEWRDTAIDLRDTNDERGRMLDLAAERDSALCDELDELRTYLDNVLSVLDETAAVYENIGTPQACEAKSLAAKVKIAIGDYNGA